MTETATIAAAVASEPSLEELWMPFTANRAFKRAPRMLTSANGMYYTSADGRQILDGTAGLWCVNAGHCREPIVRAVQQAAATLDFAPGFQMGHPSSFALAERVDRGYARWTTVARASVGCCRRGHGPEGRTDDDL